MKIHLQNLNGISLVMGSLTALAVMTLHPSGGDAAHILKTQHVLITSHSIIIFLLPFLLFGFLGLSSTLSRPNKLSNLALMIMGFSLFAAMLAASLNGISLPLFIRENYLVDPHSIKLIRSFGMSVSIPLACVFVAMSSVSILIYSLLMITLPGYSRVLGYYGLAIFILTGFSHLVDLNLIYLSGFRFFVTGILSWSFFCGILMITGKIKTRYEK